MDFIQTKLRFVESDRNGELIAFAHVNAKTGKVYGVNEDKPYRKLICVLSSELKKRNIVRPGVLYDVKMVKMGVKQGYVVKYATPTLFSVRIKTQVTPGVFYRVIVSWGHKELVYDPYLPAHPNHASLDNIVKEMEKRDDIMNKRYAIVRLLRAAKIIFQKMGADGIICPDMFKQICIQKKESRAIAPTR